MQTIYPQVIYKSIPQGILLAGLDLLRCGMDESPVRISRLQTLIDGQRFKTQASLAGALGVQPDYLSRMFKGKKALSGDMAREYENKLGLPKYWLDGEPSPVQTDSPRIAHAVKIMQEMEPYQLDMAIKIIDTIAKPAEPNGDKAA
jgi:transcriptional regulator with XRE-family HTH domain